MCNNMAGFYSEDMAAATSSSSTTADKSPLPQDVVQQINSMQEKLLKISKSLKEIQILSPKCEELQNQEQERQIFRRRVLQVCAELQDCRDVVLKLCSPPKLTKRQFDLVTSESALEDPALDPSVRFFGIDWEQLFAKSFAISLNFQIFRSQVEESQVELDLVLINSLLKDLTTIEIDVSSHGEAILHGRLSKSQQKLIQQEQTKFSCLAPPSPATKISKSRSFREANGQQRKQLQRYKKNRTADLNKLSTSSSMSHFNSMTNNNSSTKSYEWHTDKQQEQQLLPDHHCQHQTKRKASFIQNVSSIFKNMR